LFYLFVILSGSRCTWLTKIPCNDHHEFKNLHFLIALAFSLYAVLEIEGIDLQSFKIMLGFDNPKKKSQSRKYIWQILQPFRDIILNTDLPFEEICPLLMDETITLINGKSICTHFQVYVFDQDTNQLLFLKPDIYDETRRMLFFLGKKNALNDKLSNFCIIRNISTYSNLYGYLCFLCLNKFTGMIYYYYYSKFRLVRPWILCQFA
jgi:hypothetical protein